MDLKQIKELMAAMGRARIKKLTIKEKTGYELHLEQHEEGIAHSTAPITYALPQSFPHLSGKDSELPSRPPAIPSQTAQKMASEYPPIAEKEGRYVVAPLVGTFYATPSPDDPSFVKVGDRVDEHTVVCIIEAMKVMNEVKAGMSGVIQEILVENAHPVEFGTKMFRII